MTVKKRRESWLYFFYSVVLFNDYSRDAWWRPDSSGKNICFTMGDLFRIFIIGPGGKSLGGI